MKLTNTIRKALLRMVRGHKEGCDSFAALAIARGEKPSGNGAVTVVSSIAIGILLQKLTSKKPNLNNLDIEDLRKIARLGAYTRPDPFYDTAACVGAFFKAMHTIDLEIGILNRDEDLRLSRGRTDERKMALTRVGG